jgi:hypothetical protein
VLSERVRKLEKQLAEKQLADTAFTGAAAKVPWTHRDSTDRSADVRSSGANGARAAVQANDASTLVELEPAPSASQPDVSQRLRRAGSFAALSTLSQGRQRLATLSQGRRSSSFSEGERRSSLSRGSTFVRTVSKTGLLNAHFGQIAPSLDSLVSNGHGKIRAVRSQRGIDECVVPALTLHAA